MELLKDMFNTNSNLEVIELEYRQIPNLNPLMPLLQKFPKLRELSLHGNRLSQLPADLSGLKQLTSLDISNNLIQDVSSAIASLRTLPRLRRLFWVLGSEKNEEILIESLPKLIFLNHKRIQDRVEENEVVETQGEGVSLQQEDLEQIAILYDHVREFNRQFNPEKDVELAEIFDSHVKNVMLDLSNTLKPDFPESVVNEYILKAKFALYELVYIKLLEVSADRIDNSVFNTIEGLHDGFAMIFKDMANLNSSLHRGGGERIQEKSQGHPQEVQILRQEVEDLRDEVESLKEENSKYLEMIVKHAKGQKTDNQQIPMINRSKEFESSYQSNEQPHLYQDSRYTEGTRKNPQSKINLNAFVGPTTIRSLTLKQLKEFINEIYTSKVKYDEKYAEAKLPRETLEQHMYTYLNQKYGLKNLIIEWATAIINGIRKFSKEDNDVAVFGKILRNECDEEFRFAQEQVKTTVKELLKMYLRGKFPFKQNSEIKDILKEKYIGWIYEEECIDIVRYMYNSEDAELILQKLAPHLFTTPKLKSESKKLSREEQLQSQQDRDKPKAEFAKFLKIILDFQLISHEKFLRKFLALFKEANVEGNGILNENSFRALVKRMSYSISEEEIEKLLQQADPYNNQQITFSQTVSLFSQEFIKVGNANYSLLQQLAIEDAEENYS